MKRAMIAALAAGLAMAGGAQAATVIVDAQANSSTGGTGADTGLNLTLGQLFQVLVDPNDLWNAGTPPRWSNADGLTHNIYATGTDDSGAAAGTLIGINYGVRTVAGFSAPYGALVGEIGGVFHLIGTNFSGAAWNTGDLNLYYWDSNSADNTQYITAEVSSSTGVPEPATWAFMIVGFGLLGGALRAKRSAGVLAI
jgi:hypothetical protein